MACTQHICLCQPATYPGVQLNLRLAKPHPHNCNLGYGLCEQRCWSKNRCTSVQMFMHLSWPVL